jgi:hypothetical protein
MAEDDDVARRLDTIISILRIAHEEPIINTRKDVRQDKAYVAILDGATDWTPAGVLRAAVVKTGASERTFLNKATELVERGLLERRGAGPNVSYRSSGVI